ncbi:nuclease protein [Halorhabdus tiamatea SARL4B]|uniref:Nuclease protein n=2 Tax=Halorhabdus TaxID=146825 RepID=U2DNZ1_9EURY|nr:nuclease protein [Halorhabdus tiamatea SARL4B]
MVYALALDDGCYYIGKSSDPEKRITNHFHGAGAEWTKRHTPITLDRIEAVETNKDAKQREVSLFSEYVEQYGEDNVRGAGYTRVDNPSWDDS